MEFWQEWGWVLTVSSPVPINKYLWNYDFCVFSANPKFGLLYWKKKGGETNFSRKCLSEESLKSIKWEMLVAYNTEEKNMHTKFVVGNYEARIFLEDWVYNFKMNFKWNWVYWW